MGSGTAQVDSLDTMSLVDITGQHSGHGKGIPDRHGRRRRAVIFAFLAAWAVSFAALGGVIAPNTAVPSMPTPIMLLVAWIISSVTPTTGAVCVLGVSAALGIASEGLLRGLAFSMCSTAGYVGILVFVAMHPSSKAWATRGSSSSIWSNISWLLRFPSEFFMQVIWSLPRTLTLPFRAPVALLLDALAAEVCIVGHFILRVGEALGCGFGNGAAAGNGDSAVDGGKTPVIFIHGLNSSRAIWLIGMLFLKARGLHLGPLIALRYQAKEGDGMCELEATLREKVVSECECLGASRVILVGHSVGGILCAMIAESLRQEQQQQLQVDSVVCISAPWRRRQPSSSEAVTKFSILSALADMMVGLGGSISEKMKSDLSSGGMVVDVGQRLVQRSDCGVRLFNLGGQLDPLVIQPSLISEAAFRTCLTPHTAHLSPLLSYTIWGQVLVWIDREQKKAMPGESRGTLSYSAGAVDKV